jgi:exodeoxyribonuclease V beta subunit
VHQRINELEFYFPLQRIVPNQLSALFDQHMPSSLPQCRQALERLTFAPVEGFLKGFIDMVFEHGGRYYLVDWKSNLLGEHLDAYAPQSLGRIMTESYYFLQYHLYVLALDQLLRRRRPDYDYTHHFGGAYYIFLRGLGRGANGIFHDRPDVNLIARLRQALIAI